MKVLIENFKIMLSGGFLKSKWGDIGRADVFVVRHDFNCGYRYNGKVYSPIIDTIVEICLKEGMTVRSLATPFSRLVGVRAYNSPIVLNRPFLWVALISRFLAPLIGIAKSENWKARERTRLWRRVLDCVKPRLVVGIQPDVYLCRACRTLNVPVYDFQHGVIASDHWWYGDKLKNDIDKGDLPTGFLCWDEASAETLAEWSPSRGSSVEVVGNPWFQRFQYPDEKDQLVQDALAQGRVYDNDRPTILVSLQWGLHIHYYQNSDFNKVMCNALETAIKRTQEKYNWLLRLHPVQLRGQEGQFCQEYLSREFGHFSTVEWCDSSRLPLPLLLNQSDLHITDMSTVVIEAAWVGVPSALLNPCLDKGGSLEGLYQQERQSGMATVVPQDVEAIEAWIRERCLPSREVEEGGFPRDVFHSWLRKKMVISK
jgi:hypothetical protein